MNERKRTQWERRKKNLTGKEEKKKMERRLLDWRTEEEYFVSIRF